MKRLFITWLASLLVIGTTAVQAANLESGKSDKTTKVTITYDGATVKVDQPKNSKIKVAHTGAKVVVDSRVTDQEVEYVLKGRSGNGSFELNGGTIAGNTAAKDGGGVYSRGSFIMSGGSIEKETKKALRYFYGAVKEYADLVTFEAAVQAFTDTGAQYVEWITAVDERVCEVCGSRHGRKYRIDNVPRIPHYNCRCYLRRV